MIRDRRSSRSFPLLRRRHLLRQFSNGEGPFPFDLIEGEASDGEAGFTLPVFALDLRFPSDQQPHLILLPESRVRIQQTIENFEKTLLVMLLERFAVGDAP